MESASSFEDIVWACRVLNKDLDCGVQVTTLNKVFPGTIEPFACSLAREYDPDKHEIEGNWIADPKLDGLRMVVLDGVAYTRNGRTIDTVGHILEELAPYKDEFVFDGEIMGDTEFNEDSGKIRRKGTGPNKDLVYNMFDVVRREQWVSKKTDPLTRRRSILSSFAFSKSIKTVPFWVLKSGISFKDLEEIRDEVIAKGFEGIMLKNADAPYRFKRSDDVLKFKTFVSADVPIVAFQEGRKKLKGTLGAVFVDLGGVQSRVGSGFTDVERKLVWNDQKKFLGSIVEVKYQNLSPEGKMRFPSFMKFRPDKE
jgi:DNA ligase-1